jgi:N-acyl-L-homoserine lactone synthetase
MNTSGAKMIINLRHDDRVEHPALFDQMFQSRAAVFHECLGWDVTVKNGREIDKYDEEGDPVYFVAVDDHQRVLGSLRLLATTGPTMSQGEFAHLFDDVVDVVVPTIWKCARFCVPPVLGKSAQDVSTISVELLIGLCELCLASGIEFVVGVYETPMTHIYARIPTPEVLSSMRQRLSARTNGRQILVA